VIRGALPISGTYVFGPESGLSMRPRFLGPVDQGNEAAASPAGWVRAGAPPFHASWGARDFPHLIAQGQRFAADLGVQAVRVETLQIPGADHLGASYAAGEPGGVWIESADSFLKST